MNNILIIMQLVPALIAALKAIEEAIPGQGQGEQKLAAVRQMLELADSSAKALWPQISGIIGVLVNLFNSTGAWKK